ncbi:MAG: GNAT family N-acetyltransferase [Verrucomicrobia bacterium]|nr:GNAT family N-acetyltransferase [Verrucomicrobiota bacterium]
MGSIVPVFTPLAVSEHDAVAVLLHRSLAGWYESKLGQGARFGDRPEPFRLIPEVYAALDPDEALAARAPDTGQLLGVCFVHPRPTHVSLGIVAVAPEAQGLGVARGLLTRALAEADARGVPTRLVSSLLNLDSFSLYTRHGFVPEEVYQDIVVPVPPDGLRLPPGLRAWTAEEQGPVGTGGGARRVRAAKPTDAARITAYERARRGIARPADHALFLANRVGDWRVWVAEDDRGTLTGYLVASVHPHHRAIGPGAVDDEATAEALLLTALDSYRGGSVLVLAPAAAAGLVALLYALGGRNVELHVAQSRPVPVPMASSASGSEADLASAAVPAGPAAALTAGTPATGSNDGSAEAWVRSRDSVRAADAAARVDASSGGEALPQIASRGFAFPTFLPESA